MLLSLGLVWPLDLFCLMRLHVLEMKHVWLIAVITESERLTVTTQEMLDFDVKYVSSQFKI